MNFVEEKAHKDAEKIMRGQDDEITQANIQTRG